MIRQPQGLAPTTVPCLETLLIRRKRFVFRKYSAIERGTLIGNVRSGPTFNSISRGHVPQFRSGPMGQSLYLDQWVTVLIWLKGSEFI